MKILLCQRPGGAFAYISDGWINALKDAGHAVKRWDGEQASWHAFEPDIYIGCSGHRQFIPSRRDCQVAIHVNPYGQHEIEPNICEKPEVIEWVQHQKPDAVFGYGHPSDSALWCGWDRHGMPWVPMATAADMTIYSPNNGDHKQFDLAYVGGRWDYKAKNIDLYLVPVLTSGRYKTNVWGWGKWPMAVKRAEDKDVPKILASAKVGPCIAEPHTTEWGIDVPERVFKVIASGALAIHDRVKGFDRYLPSVPVAENPKQYANMIAEWVRASDESRNELWRKQYTSVAASHTYHHRLATLFRALGREHEANHMIQVAKKYGLDSG